MTTATVIINRAWRETQLLPSDVTPSTSQYTESLPLLQGLLERHIRAPILTIWLGNVTALRQQRGVVLRDFTPYADRVAVPQDVYVNCVLDGPKTLMLPPTPGDGARIVIIDVSQNFGTYPLTLTGNGNLIDGGADLVLSASGEGVSLMYRRDLAEWVPITTLELSNNLPYPAMYDDLFVIELAMRLDPRYGKEMPAVTADIYRSIRSQFVGRYMMVQSSASPDVLWEGSLIGNGWTIGNAGGW